MKLFPNTLPLLSLSLAGLLNLGCSNVASREQLDDYLKRQDNWTIFGKVTSEGYENGEVLAISGDGSRFRTSITEEQNFGLELPGNTSYAMYFLPASTHTKPALLNFENSLDTQLDSTLRLPEPRFDPYLDLGEIDIHNQAAFPTKNPSSRLDFDTDGVHDLNDIDDQNDGITDSLQRHEQTSICHVDKRNRMRTIEVDLPELYLHMEHGDNPWPCRKARGAYSESKRVPQSETTDDLKSEDHENSGQI